MSRIKNEGLLSTWALVLIGTTPNANPRLPSLLQGTLFPRSIKARWKLPGGHNAVGSVDSSEECPAAGDVLLETLFDI
jgi:hypothetical protein